MDHRLLESLKDRLRDKGIDVPRDELEDLLGEAMSKLRASLGRADLDESGLFVAEAVRIYDSHCIDRN